MRHVVAVVALVATGASCTEPPKMMRRRARTNEVVLGAVLPLTGPRAAYGVGAKCGIDLAVSQQNDSGGVLGRSVRVVYIDNRADVTLARKGAERLVAKDKVVMLLGASGSEAASAMAQVAVRAKTVMITPSATAPAVTQHGPYAFRICFVDPFQSRAMAKFARVDLKLGRVAVLRDLGSDYAVRLAESFEEAFTRRGGAISVSEGYLAEDASFTKVITAVIESNAEALYLPGYYEEVRRITTEARRLGFTGHFLGADGWDTRQVYDIGAAIDGAIFTTHFAHDDPRADVTAFKEAYIHAMNEAPDAIAALAYDATRFGLLAIQRAQSTDREAIRSSLVDAKPFEGVSGTIRLDADRNASKPAFIVRMEGGVPTFVTKVGPIARPPMIKP